MAGGIGIPICVQCGTASNPCRCKVVGPTLGFLAFAVAAVVEWPVGALVYCFKHVKGRRIMAHPAAVVYPSVTNAIPI
ncbi:cold-regulated protein [Trema orientale]|uniref:Cold-regulated protein n=1 Tax=Trema orientale TaxID=63057 RepID=A0A2P5E795_TREOI|nr:cold-regulated protein [Trema orientale]